MFATREAFAATGGFSEQAYAGEEVLFSLRMQRWGRRHGKRFCVLREPRAEERARQPQSDPMLERPVDERSQDVPRRRAQRLIL